MRTLILQHLSQFFYQNGNAGACGKVHGDDELIAAIDHELWGDSSFSNGSSTCGKKVKITNTKNGKSVTATIADVCPTCENGVCTFSNVLPFITDSLLIRTRLISPPAPSTRLLLLMRVWSPSCGPGLKSSLASTDILHSPSPTRLAFNHACIRTSSQTLR